MDGFNFPVATSVSRTLREDGFLRSETHTTRVRGYHRTTRGFTVKNATDGTVRVDWYTGLNVHTDEHKAETRRQFTEMVRTLRKKGYLVTTSRQGIVVTRKKA